MRRTFVLERNELLVCVVDDAVEVDVEAEHCDYDDPSGDEVDKESRSV
jgi:hypothetical protein